ncbi:hypothetical protein [Aestuariicoccus sp. MJ-SS9]|uniref:hypothetical protein n=1 Tax=Aestuariicoccus sp. MJ-SS9 TaxID=3079855 RepID=UPI00290B6623|nr:hypothetical protein [Aestuariicoccus sp. MJ-SS9]MDU8911845.1 hypothetical protein [Aestuariicoccus sp. MJ-SS9]
MLVIAGLILAFILIAVFQNRATRLCRWRMRREGGETSWRCVYCGATARGERPKTCLRDNT